jgi:hypothetical protein
MIIRKKNSTAADKEASDMFTIQWIPDMRRFLSLVQECRGPVGLCLADGTVCDLKSDPVASQLLLFVQPPQTKLRLRVPDPCDRDRFLRYLLESGRLPC